MTILYLSYNGLMEPLGQSQVFQYLQKLARDYKIILVTYEKKQDWNDKARRKSILHDIQVAGICWIPLRYHKNPSVPATILDLAIGFFVCFYLILRYRIQIVHVRGYALSILGLCFKKIFGVRFIFDMRGFWPDDLLAAGVLKESQVIYKIGKWFERQFLVQADVIVSLTQKAVDLMKGYSFLKGKNKSFIVIPTCTNLDLFRPVIDRHKKLGNVGNRSFTLGYVGNAGSFYLFNEALEFFKILRQKQPDSYFLIINRDDHAYILECLKDHKIEKNFVGVRSVDYKNVPFEMAKMDAGVFFYAQANAHISRAPTKLGEFLACGIPCLASAGVGDVQEILEGSRTGVVVSSFDASSLEKAVDQLLALVKDPEVKSRCIATAQRCFSLEMGVKAYDRIYHDLMRGRDE